MRYRRKLRFPEGPKMAPKETQAGVGTGSVMFSDEERESVFHYAFDQPPILEEALVARPSNSGQSGVGAPGWTVASGLLDSLLRRGASIEGSKLMELRGYTHETRLNASLVRTYHFIDVPVELSFSYGPNGHTVRCERSSYQFINTFSCAFFGEEIAIVDEETSTTMFRYALPPGEYCVLSGHSLFMELPLGAIATFD